MARREYRVVKRGCCYTPQMRYGWRTLWLWLGLGGIEQAAWGPKQSAYRTLAEAQANIRSRERRYHSTPTPELIVAHMAPRDPAVEWAETVVDGEKGGGDGA